MENVQNPDPYEAVLADLRAKRAQIDHTIALLEGLRTGVVGNTGQHGPEVANDRQVQAGNRPSLGPGAFLGMTIHDAAKKLLAFQRRQMPTSEIVQELERGGLVLHSADKLNTVGSVLLRRFNTVGDVVRVGRGLWGLQEWYPGRKFAGSKGKAEESSKGAHEEQEGATVGNEADTETDKPIAGTAGWMDFTPNASENS